jgi:hypothetical protein
MDRRANEIKKNADRRTRKEIEAFYKGRESALVPAPKPEPQQTSEDKPPERGQFESYEAFIEAKAEYTGRRAAREDRTKAEQEAQVRAASEKAAAASKDFQTKVRTKFPDIDSRLEEVGDAPIHKEVQNAVTESEFGAEIFNELVGKPGEFERLFKLSPTAAIREIGKLEARFEAAAQKKPEPEKKEAKASAAPAPINPLGGKAVSGDAEPSHDNPEAWAAWRNRQVQARRKGNGASR